MTKALSNQKRPGTGCLRAFFLIFLLAGLGFGYVLFGRPVYKITQARDWKPVPCTILSSKVDSSSDSDGTTYRVDIHFRYVVEDRSYESGNYDFTGKVFSGGADGKRAIAAMYRKGDRATCYVNPNDPTDAVINREFSSALWLGFFLPGIFAAVGLLGFIFAGRLTGLPAKSQDGTIVGAVVPDAPTGATALKSQSSPVGTFIAILVFALIWNGIVSVMFFVGKDVPWFFKAIFGGVGVLLIFAAMYQLLALFNPRALVAVNSGALLPGGELTVDWSFRGNASRIRRLHIHLRGREEATYQRGTSTSTDKNIFAEMELFDGTEAGSIGGGQARVVIPSDAMHTFTAPNNKIVWNLDFHGEIPNWPDVKEEFPIIVLPRRTTDS